MEEASFWTKLSITSSLILFLVYLYYKYAFSYWKKRGFKYLEPTLVFGNIQPLVFQKVCIGEMLHIIYQKLKAEGLKYGGYFALGEPILLILDPELIKAVLVKDFSHFSERGMHYDEDIDPMSAHLAAIRNPKWTKLRRVFTTTFTTAKIKMLFPTLKGCGDALVDAIGKLSDAAQPIDTREIMARYSTDIIGTTAFGIECNSLKDPEAEFRKAGKAYFDVTFRNSLIFALAFLSPTMLKFFKIPISNPVSSKFFINAIKETVDFREKNNVVKKDMMSLLIKLKNSESLDDETGNTKNAPEDAISFNELAAQAFFFFMAGFESSSATITFTLYELLKHEDMQDKVRKEINDELERSGGELTYEAVMNMTYLDNLVCETLRLYPTLPFLNRECTKDFVIPGTNKVIEKGARITISLLGIHRDPDYFDDPETYDPDRFSEGRKSEIKPATYMPWGIGPRNCLAFRFGMLNAKIGLASMLKNFKFSLYPGTELPVGINPFSLSYNLNGTLWLKATRI